MKENSEIAESDASSQSSAMAKNEDSGSGQVLYVVASFVMFCFFMYRGMNEHGSLFAICIFPWYMFKAVLWPVFLIFRMY